MKEETLHFDQLSSDYEELLRDPIRDRFSGNESIFFHQRKRDLVLEYFKRRAVDTRSHVADDAGVKPWRSIHARTHSARHTALHER